MAVIVVCTICFINLLLWFLFFKKFNKLFSTDDIIENTRSELNKMILDVNRNAERNITLIESRISDLKAVIAQADTHLSLLKSEIETKRMAEDYKSKVESAVNKSVRPSYKVEAYMKNASQKKNPSLQQSLFQTENTVPLQEDLDSSYTEVPVLGSNVHLAEEPIVMKKTFNQEVNERYMRGETVEEIATALSRSVTEVQFALDMNE